MGHQNILPTTGGKKGERRDDTMKRGRREAEGERGGEGNLSQRRFSMCVDVGVRGVSPA